MAAGATLLYGDCLDHMKAMPDKSVDLFVCDLPYGCLSHTNQFREWTDKQVLTGCAWDVKLDLDQFWDQVKRLCRDDHTPVLMFCSTKFGFELYNSNPSWFRYDLVWNKMRGVSYLSANKMPMRSHEMVYVFAKKGAKYHRKDIEGDFPRSGATKKGLAHSNVYNGGVPVERLPVDNAGKRCVLSVVDMIGKTKKGNHPTQKPDDLYAWLIDRYSKEGDTILDPTAGSFSSVFTAHKMGRKAIGIEKDETFFAKAIQASLVNLTDK
jgi:site-specific DNA-methyltransferase (adenine-specific)